jgi:TetR/AcrR family acrAB operon transcriptional repressor
MATTAESAADRGAITRAALVQSATQLFVEEGYGAVSVRDLARRTGLTTGAIYGHFRNKADLLVAAISDRIAAELETPSVAHKGPTNLLDSIGRQWRTYRSRSAMRALLVEGAAAARVDEDVRTELSETLEAKLDEWRAIYHDIQESEHLDPQADMETLMVMLFAAELGLGVLESIGVALPKPLAWERTIERLLGTVYRGRRR